MEYVTKAIGFLKEAYAELKKVSWLSRKEVTGSTVVIIIFILAVALFVGIVDFFLTKIVQVILGTR
ncbi:MAG: preprotein translocase subunit SecE [Elusimicrobiota bacterium]